MADGFKKLIEKGKNNVEDFVEWLRTGKTVERSMTIDEAFEKLKQQGKNDLDNLMQWMKDAKIVDGIKVTEEKARELFQRCDPKNVDVEKFKEALEKMAVEHKRTADELSKSLVAEGTKVAGAFKAGLSAFKDAMK